MDEIEKIIQPCNTMPDKDKYVKLALDPYEKMHMSELYSEIPSLISANALSNAYVMSLPAGVSPSDLMQYKSGGVGNTYFGSKGITGHAPLYSLNKASIATGAFSVMSIASGQYYLNIINNSLDTVNQKTDEILDFLYEDKKAELLSELSFINYAYDNFRAIMKKPEQVSAIISNIQHSEKVTLKDVYFFMNDLENVCSRSIESDTDTDKHTKAIFKLQDRLTCALKAYMMCNALEISYTQNFDTGYIEYIRNRISNIAKKYHNNVLTYMQSAYDCVKTYKNSLGGVTNRKKKDKEIENAKKSMQDINNVIESLKNGNDFFEQSNIQNIFLPFEAEKTYYLDSNSDLYLKINI